MFWFWIALAFFAGWSVGVFTAALCAVAAEHSMDSIAPGAREEVDWFEQDLGGEA